VKSKPRCGQFRPVGVPAASLEEVVLTIDEFEAIRLVDHERLYQQTAAEAMGVSRQTLGRILECGRGKIAKAVVHAKSLRIEGGTFNLGEKRCFVCRSCDHRWSVPYGPRPEGCSACRSREIFRCDFNRKRGGGPRSCGRERCRRRRNAEADAPPDGAPSK
jgi:predicted DNA-binding protein (UPF0251 family)